jgi:hypothetical protein
LLSLLIMSGFISSTILGGMAIHGLTDRAYGEGSKSSLDRMIEAWREDRQAKREQERAKLKFLESHLDE